MAVALPPKPPGEPAAPVPPVRLAMVLEETVLELEEER